jgi:predicted nucleotidyltransferase
MHEHIIRIKDVAKLLKRLNLPFVFVGGATVALYATFPDRTEDIRPTEDVNVVVELLSYAGYAEINEKMIALGFSNDMESGVICRFKILGLAVDIMPTDPNVIGFSNRWYPDGFKFAETIVIDGETSVKIFSVPYFLASKWEAFKSRGKRNFRASHDFEDMVFVFEQCHDLELKISNAPEDVRQYLWNEIGSMLDNDDFIEGVGCHMQNSYYGTEAAEIIDKLRSALLR